MDVLDRVLESLAGEGAGIERSSAELARFLDDGHSFGQFRRLDGCFLAGWSTADYHHVVGSHRGAQGSVSSVHSAYDIVANPTRQENRGCLKRGLRRPAGRLNAVVLAGLRRWRCGSGA